MFFEFLCEGIGRVTVNEPAPFLYDWSLEAGQTDDFDDAVAQTCHDAIDAFRGYGYYDDLNNISAIVDVSFPASLKEASEMLPDDYQDLHITIQCEWEADPNHINILKYRLRSRLLNDIIAPYRALQIREDQTNAADQYRASPYVADFIGHVTTCFDELIRNDIGAAYNAFTAAQNSRDQVTQVGTRIGQLIDHGGPLAAQEQVLVDLDQSIYDAMGEELDDLQTAGNIVAGG